METKHRNSKAAERHNRLQSCSFTAGLASARNANKEPLGVGELHSFSYLWGLTISNEHFPGDD